MRKHFFKTVILFGAVFFSLASCEPLEPSTYMEKFNRIGTVVVKDNNAEFSIDYTGEKIVFDNFKSPSDLTKYNVQNGDRVIANMTLSAIGNVGKFHINSMEKVNITKIDSVAPSDTLNHYFRFALWQLDNRFRYPDIWSNGHFINILPVANPAQSETKNVKYHLYPIDFKSDTLILQLSANVPGNDRENNYEYASLISCDMSSLRDATFSEEEQIWRDSIFNHFDNAKFDSIYIQVTSHDSVWYHFRDTITWVKGGAVETRIPFDF